MIWATVSCWSCFCWLYSTSPSLAAKNIINLTLVLAIWWCPCIESSLLLCCWERVFAMTSVFSWQTSISLCPASFRTPGPNLPVTPCCYKRLYFILCYSWVTFHCMCVCVHTTSSLAIHLSVDIWFVSMSWLLWTVLLWTLGCMYLFRIKSFVWLAAVFATSWMLSGTFSSSGCSLKKNFRY